LTLRVPSEWQSSPHDRETLHGAALALAFAGNYSRSLALANDLEKQLTTRAVLALKHRDPTKAVELLQVAVAHELSVPRSSLQGFFGALYPV